MRGNDAAEKCILTFGAVNDIKPCTNPLIAIVYKARLSVRQASKGLVSRDTVHKGNAPEQCSSTTLG